MVMNTEDDLHFPTLKVAETVGFAASTKVAKARSSPAETLGKPAEKSAKSTLESLGIAHTRDTVVGNEFIRGVSGGERKRLSHAEVMETGVHASNALEFVKVLRHGANEQQRSIVATLYQAGNSIYAQFDKVVVLAEGREIYYGPAQDAKKYFEDMGFECAPGANTADFLTSVVVDTERSIKSEFKNMVPHAAPEFETRYRDSTVFSHMMADMELPAKESLSEETKSLKDIYDLEKSRTFDALSRDVSPYHVSFTKQVSACTVR
ncbi:hypothetical protein ACHAQH_008754 [Verticillium albo-atrum]